MLQITVNGKELVTYKDTTLNIDMSNAIFGSDTIEGDICYGFEIPIKGNEIALDYSHSAYARGARTFNCLLLIDGLSIIAGKLIVRQSDYSNLSVDVVCNPYPDGWSGQSVRDDFTETITIGTDYATHLQRWKQYLLSTTESNSDIKFGLHQNDKNYGSDNQFFGQWNGIVQRKLVNRLYLNSNNELADNLQNPFIRLFNKLNTIRGEEETTIDINQFCFCPQIRLRKAMKQILESSGYNVTGTFFSDTTLANVFLQSMVALDGDIFQYLNDSSSVFLFARFYDSEDLRFWRKVYVWRDSYDDFWYDTTGNEELFSSDFGQTLKNDRISKGIHWGGYADNRNYVLLSQYNNSFISCNNGAITFSNAGVYSAQIVVEVPKFTWSGQYTMPVKLMLCKGSVESTADDDKIVLSVVKNISKFSSANIDNNTLSLSGNFNVENADVGATYYVIAAYMNREGLYRSIPSKGDAQINLIDIDENAPLNIFAKSFDVNKCLPDVTNSEFVNAIRKAFGLTYYIDALQKIIEVDTVKDVMNAKSIDLTEYLLNRETELKFDEKKVTFRYGGLDSTESIDEDKSIAPVATLDDLPDAQRNVGKICFVTGMNAHYVSEKQDSETDNFAYSWKRYCGNTSEISAGSGESEQLKSDAVVPYLCRYEKIDDTGAVSNIPDIPLDIESKMFNDTLSDKIVLLYYRGLQKMLYRRTTYRFESMTPVETGEESISTSSIGTSYVLPWIRMYAAYGTVSYKFRMPTLKMIEVARMLQPQNVPMKEQTRWLMVENVRSMPRKINFQVDNNDGMILCEIEAAILD